MIRPAVILACACTVLAKIYVTKSPPFRPVTLIRTVRVYPNITNNWRNITATEMEYPSHQSGHSSQQLPWEKNIEANDYESDSSSQENSSWESAEDDKPIPQLPIINEDYSSVKPHHSPGRPRPYKPSQYSYDTFPTQFVDPDSFLYPSNPPSQYPDKQKYPSGQDSFSLWHPPKFYQALKDFDLVDKEIQSHTAPAGGSTKSFSRDRLDERRRYSVLLGVIEGLIHVMTSIPLEYYDQEYDSGVRDLLEYYSVNPLEGVTQWNCVQNSANQHIIHMRDIINNKWVKRVCSFSSKMCDFVITAIVDIGSREKKNEGELLIALGNVSAIFLDKYAVTLEHEATSTLPNIPQFFKHAKDYLKPLILAGAQARKLFPTKIPCYDDHNSIDN